MRCNVPYAIGDDRAEHDRCRNFAIYAADCTMPSILTAPRTTRGSSVGTNIDCNAAKDMID
jgi:hypothetical protein